MTITATSNATTFSGNGATTVFPFTFPFFLDGDLIVTLTSAAGVETAKAINTDYSVTGAGTPSGGSITMAVPPASGESLTVERVVPLTQETDLQNQGPYLAETVENAFDKLTMIDQQQQVGIDSVDARIAAAVAGVSAGIYNPVTATGSTVARSLQDRFAVDTSGEDFGMLPSASAAVNTAALVEAGAKAPSGSVLRLDAPGIYLLNPVVFTKSLHIKLGTGVTLKANSLTDELGLITFQGNLTATVATLTAPVVPGQMTLPLSQMSGLANDDWLWIQDTSQAASLFVYEPIQLQALSGASGAGTGYLYSGPTKPFTYPSGATGTVTKANMLLNPIVEGGKIDGNGLGGTNVSLIQFAYCVNAEIRFTQPTNWRFIAFERRYCKGIKLLGIDFFKSNADLSAATPPDAGYGLGSRLSSMGGSAVLCTAKGMRHAFSIGEGSRDFDIDGGDYSGCYAGAIMTHFRGAGMIRFRGCLLSGTAFKSATDHTLSTQSPGILSSTSDTTLIFSLVQFQHTHGGAIRFSSSVLQNTYVIVESATVIECSPDTANSEGIFYFVNLKGVSIGKVFVARTDTVNVATFRIQSCEDVLIDGAGSFSLTSQSGAGQRGFHLIDCKRFQLVNLKGKLDGTSSRFIQIDSTNLGDSDTGTVLNCQPVVSGGADAYIKGANATNVVDFNNNWNTGAVPSNLNGGLALAGNTFSLGANASSGPVTASINGAAASVRDIRLQTAGIDRWFLRANADAESGTNAGTALEVIARADDGTLIDIIMSAVRAVTGAITWTRQHIFSAGTTARSSVRLPHGAAPSSPVNGDVWTTTAGIFVRINGATVGPLT